MPHRDSTPRSVALDLLSIVLGAGRPLDEAIDDHPGFDALASRDRAFARRLLATTLRRLGQIDALIGACLERPLPRKAHLVTQLLRLGACQLVFLGTAPHAAVDTAVALARSRGLAFYAGLVNAVLRRLARDGAKMAAAQDAPRLATPDWLWRAWTATYGEATCRRIAEAHLDRAPLDLSFKEAGAAARWAAKLNGVVLSTGTLRIAEPHGAVADLPGFAEGAWWVQDAAAALPAVLLGAVAGRTVIDLCAAPGGKTAQLAAAGARVIAVERATERLGRLAANLERLGLDAETVAADAADWRPTEPADAVLLDAPCTATGTIRRRPDVLHLKRPGDVAALAAAQERLIDAALDMVRPGGLVVYAACSLQPEEGAAHLARLLESGAPVEPLPVAAAEVGGLRELIDAEGNLRTLPCHLAETGGLDGFFAARLRRR